MRIVACMLAAIFLCGPSQARAQLRLTLAPFAGDYTLAAAEPATPLAQPQSVQEAEPAPPLVQPQQVQDATKPALTPSQLRWRNAGLIAGGALLVGAYGMNKWWYDGFGSFDATDEGWFKQETQYGGADKFGHSFFSYMSTRLMALGFEAIGNTPDASIKLGFWSTLGIMVGVEIVDGYSKKYSFSKEDAIADLVGAGFGYYMHTHPGLDRLLDWRLLYRQSAESSSFSPGADYSGQTYLFVLKASGIDGLRQHSLLRYLELDLGYGTRGFDEPAGNKGDRNIYYGVSLNLSEVLAQTVFKGSKEPSRTQRATDWFLEFVQVPGTAALAHHTLSRD